MGEALKGVRIVDFSGAWAAPLGIGLLGLLGAEVIKVESMNRLDMLRRVLDVITYQPMDLGRNPYFNDINVNKLSVRLDITQPKGAGIAKRLVKASDVVAENYRPGVLDRFGLGYSALKAVKEEVIMLSLSAGGQRGPEATYIGYAPCFGALGGLGHLTGYADCPPAEMRHPVDTAIGFAVAFSILAALNHKRMTGRGQFIDLSAREVITCLVGDFIMDYQMSGRIQSRSGNRDDIMAPHNTYRCSGEDHWVSIAISTEEEWEAFCQAIGNPSWTKDEKFSDELGRWRNQDELDKLVQSWTANKTDYEVMDLLQKAGVAAVPSFRADELFTDPHLQARGFITQIEHPVTGVQMVINPPWNLSATPAQVTSPAPLVGQHNEYVFGELLGMSTEEITRLEEEKVIY